MYYMLFKLKVPKFLLVEEGEVQSIPQLADCFLLDRFKIKLPVVVCQPSNTMRTFFRSRAFFLVLAALNARTGRAHVPTGCRLATGALKSLQTLRAKQAAWGIFPDADFCNPTRRRPDTPTSVRISWLTLFALTIMTLFMESY